VRFGDVLVMGVGREEVGYKGEGARALKAGEEDFGVPRRGEEITGAMGAVEVSKGFTGREGGTDGSEVGGGKS